jgi:hypothetical protein
VSAHPEIVAVLVVADAGSPLLAPGRCGATPPMVMDLNGTGLWIEVDLPEDRGIPFEDDALSVAALPLWWDGALVPEGWARAVTVQWLHARSEVILAGIGLVMEPTPFQVEQVGLRLVSLRLASRIVLLARDNGRLVEVQP